MHIRISVQTWNRGESKHLIVMTESKKLQDPPTLWQTHGLFLLPPPYSSSLCPSVRPSSLLSSSLSASVSLIPPAPSLHSSLHFTSSFPLSLFLPLVCFCACVRRYIDTQAWDVDWRGVRRDAVSPLGDLSNRRALEKKFHYQVCMIARCGAVSLQ